MTWKILVSLLLGVILGRLLPPEAGAALDQLSTMSLAVLLFAVGFSLGEEEDLGQKIKGLPKLSLAVPFLIAAGSLLGAVLFGLPLGLKGGDAALVGAGFGWYSLSAAIIAQTYDLALGALALLTNVFREVLALLLIPFLAKRLGKITAVAPGGATTMDVTLPLVAANTDPETTLIAFYSGTVLSTMVPILVPFLIRLLQA